MSPIRYNEIIYCTVNADQIMVSAKNVNATTDISIILYNILYFLWLYNEFFIILYNILKIAELDCCQIIILSIYVPSTHAYTHVFRLSLDLPYEKR